MSNLTDFIKVISLPQQQQYVDYEIVNEEEEADQENEDTKSQLEIHLSSKQQKLNYPGHSTPVAAKFTTPKVVKILKPQTSPETLKLLESIEPASSNSSNDPLTNPFQIYMVCETCGMAFVRGSMNDSITKHGRETTCFPFKCLKCDKFFKKPEQLRKHNIVHSKRQASTMDKQKQPQMKRVTPFDFWVVKEPTFKINLVQESNVKMEQFVDDQN